MATSEMKRATELFLTGTLLLQKTWVQSHYPRGNEAAHNGPEPQVQRI